MNSPAQAPIDLSSVPERWHLLARVAAAVGPKRLLFKRGTRIGIVFAEGDRFVLQPTEPVMLSARFDASADAIILTNTKTLRELLDGSFDPEEPGEGHLFLWSGSEGALNTLASALKPGTNMIALRAAR